MVFEATANTVKVAGELPYGDGRVKIATWDNGDIELNTNNDNYTAQGLPIPDDIQIEIAEAMDDNYVLSSVAGQLNGQRDFIDDAGKSRPLIQGLLEQQGF